MLGNRVKRLGFTIKLPFARKPRPLLFAEVPAQLAIRRMGWRSGISGLTCLSPRIVSAIMTVLLVPSVHFASLAKAPVQNRPSVSKRSS